MNLPIEICAIINSYAPFVYRPIAYSGFLKYECACATCHMVLFIEWPSWSYDQQRQVTLEEQLTPINKKISYNVYLFHAEKYHKTPHLKP